MDKLAIKLSTSIIGVSASISGIYSAITKKDILVLGRGSAVGVDRDIFSMNGRNPESFKLGFAGRIAQDKGISDLLIIYKKLKKINSKTTLEIIGEIDFSDPVDVSLVKEIESDPDINWIRHCSRIELASHMKRWALQILLSQREGLGNVIIEAGACGIPTICWDVTGVRDAIPNFLGKNLIQNNRMDLLYSRIKEYLDNPLSTMEASELSSWTIENFEKNMVLNNFVNHVNYKILEKISRN
jgi:glycosyltransferase involved in cell wall biosynthesis